MSTIETNQHHTETDNITNTTNADESDNMDASNATTATATTVRKRTRATAEQLSVLEDTFAANVSPNSKLRKELSERLQMSERSIQIWFQNRRAKVKHVQKRAQMQMQQASIRAQLYHYHQQQQYGMQPYGGTTTPIMPLPQQHQPQHMYAPRVPLPRSSSMDYHHQQHHHSLPTPPASSASPVASLDPSIPPTNHLSSYPSQDNMEFPDYLQGSGVGASTGGPLSPSLSPHQVHPPPVEPPTTSSSMPSLVAVPDAGPTAMLATTSSTSVSSSTTDHLVSTPATPPSSTGDQTRVSSQDIWPVSVHKNEHMMRSQSVSISSSLPLGSDPCSSDLSAATNHPLERSFSNPPMTTIDPSNLMMNTSSSNSSSNGLTTDHQLSHAPLTSSSPLPLADTITTTTDIYLNCTTLTIGTWHRLKLRASDLLCTFKNNNNRPTFEWQIEDAGCHFKMEIPLSSIASIDMVQDPAAHGFADVHFDISESPLFYMETTTGSTSDNGWVQCSDFTEGKQASRFFRHSLKGMAPHLKHDLMTLMDQCPESRRWIRFLDPIPHQPSSMSYQPQPPPPPPQYQQQSYYAPSEHHHPYSTDAFVTTGAGNDFGGVYPTNDPAFSSMYIPPPPPPNASAASSYWYQVPQPSSQMMCMAPLV